MQILKISLKNHLEFIVIRQIQILNAEFSLQSTFRDRNYRQHEKHLEQYKHASANACGHSLPAAQEHGNKNRRGDGRSQPTKTDPFPRAYPVREIPCFLAAHRSSGSIAV